MGNCQLNPPGVFMAMAGPPPVTEAERKIIALAGAKTQPPMAHPVFLSAWPSTPATGWCGQHMAVPNSFAPDAPA